MIRVRSNSAAREQRYLRGLKRGFPKAIQRGVNDTAFQARKSLIQSLKTSFDRPTPFTLRAFYVDRAKGTSITAWIRTQPRQEEYLLRNQVGGFRRPENEWIIVPAPGTRRNQYGNLTRVARKKLFSDPKNYVIEVDPSLALIRRKVGGRFQTIAFLKRLTRYRGRWNFYRVAERTVNANLGVNIQKRISRLERRG